MSTTQESTTVKTDREQALEAYIAKKSELQGRWSKIQDLKGDAYSKAVGQYSRDKAKLKADWKAFQEKFGG
jgi:hypothetical protein